METVIEYISLHKNVQELLVYTSKEISIVLLKLFLHYRYDIKNFLRIGLQYDVAISTEPTLFRSETTGIKLVLEYVKCINHKLIPLCKLIIDKVCRYNKSIEINKCFIDKKTKISENVKNIIPLLDSCLVILSEGFYSLSMEFSTILKLIATETNKRYETSGLKFVTTVFFLRIFCPIISMPQNYLEGIDITSHEQRNLIIVSKLLQSIASGCTDIKELEDYVKHNALIMHNCIASLIFRSDNTPLCTWVILSNEKLEKYENMIGLLLSEKLQLLDADGNYDKFDSPDVKHKLKTNLYKPIKINSIRSPGGRISPVESKKNEDIEVELSQSSEYNSPKSPSFNLDLSALSGRSHTSKDMKDSKVLKLISGSEDYPKGIIKQVYPYGDTTAERYKSNSSIEQKAEEGAITNRIPTYRRLKLSMTHNLITSCRSDNRMSETSSREKYEKVTELDINNLTNREILILRIMLTSTDIYIKGLTSLSSEKLELYKSRLLNDNAMIWTNRCLNNWIKKEIAKFDISEYEKYSLFELIQVWKLDGWSFIQLNNNQLSFMKAESSIKIIIMRLVDILKRDAIFTIRDFYQAKGKLESWSNDDVVIWLLLSNMEKYVSTFRELCITGNDLFNVSPDYLRFLGVKRINDQMKIISLR